MRFITVTAMMAVVLLRLCQPAIPAEVTVVQGGKTFAGWSNDRGKLVILNSSGRTIMYGEINRMGAVELTLLSTGETFVGKVNPMGHGLLISTKTSETIKLEVER